MVDADNQARGLKGGCLVAVMPDPAVGMVTNIAAVPLKLGA